MFDSGFAYFQEVFDNFLFLFDKEWLLWGFMIMLFFPIALVIINEFHRRLSDHHNDLKNLLLKIRNILLPLIVIYILLLKISPISSDDFYIKIVTTALWLLLLNFSLNLFNILLFSEGFKFEEKAPKLLIDIARIFLILLGTTFIVSFLWGFDLTKLLAALGMGSVVLGLALKDVLGSLFSGVALISSKPFKVGEWIRVGDSEGEVQNINWRSVSVKTKDNFIIIIPNSVIVNRELSNFSQPSLMHRDKIDIDLSLETPPNKVINLLIETASKTPGVLQHPKPSAFISKYNKEVYRSIQYRIIFHIKQYKEKTAIKKELMSHIWYACQREGIEFSKEYTPEKWKYYNYNTQLIMLQLKELEIFDIYEEDLLEIAKNSKVVLFGENEIIIENTKVNQFFYVVLSGHVKQCFNCEISSSENTFYELGKGDFFGFSGILTQQSENEFIQTTSEAEIITIEMQALRNILQKHPQVADCLEGILHAKLNLINLS